MLEQMFNSPVVAVDLETSGFDWSRHDKIIGVSFAWMYDSNILVGTYIRDLTLAKHLYQQILKQNTIVVGWGFKFDLHFLRKKLDILQFPTRLWDGMISSHLLDENTDNELKSSCERVWGSSVGKWEDILHQWRKEGRLKSDSKIWDYYGTTDAILALMWYQHYHKQIELEFGPLWKTEMALIPVLTKMEERGVLIDTDYLSRLPLSKDRGGGGLQEELEQAIERLRLLTHPGFNYSSPKQVSEWLYNKLKLRPRSFSERTGRPKADEEALRTYATHPIVAAIIRCREIEKLLTNYIDGILEKVDARGYLHGKFNQIGTVSGRLSSSEPNLQNIPRGPLIRRAFLADPWLFDNDASQVEARLFAHFSSEPALIQAFEEGLDIHAKTASDVLKIPIGEVNETQRKRAKATTFGIMYGSGGNKQARVLGISKRAASDFITRYFQQYPAIRSLQNRTRSTIESRGYIRNPFGRKRRLHPQKAYQAVNSLIQGTAADILKQAMVRLDRIPQIAQRLSVHDEIAWDLIEGDPIKVTREVDIALHDFPGFRPAIKWDFEHSHKNWAEKEVWKWEENLAKV